MLVIKTYFLALDLLEKMLDFDPEKRITVVQALEHPWLSAYHDVEDEPQCPEPYDKWHAIEKLETIEDYREALWNEIQEYRNEVRSVGIDMAYLETSSSMSPLTRHFPIEETESSQQEGRPHTPPPDIRLGAEQLQDTETETAVEEGAVGKDTLPEKKKSSEISEETTTTAKPISGAELTAVPSPVASLRPSIERRDSLRPGTPASISHDPVVHYARRSSILKAQQWQSGNSVSPVRQTSSGMQMNEEIREGFPVTSSQVFAPPMGGSMSSSASYFPPPSGSGVPGGVGSIPFPSSSYIMPTRSRTASMMGADPGAMSFMGARKLLRTLSTVSIHESVEEHGGLAAMGPMGQAIIERRETAADAPASGMPRDFDPLTEGDEETAATSANGDTETKTARSAGAGQSGGSIRFPVSGTQTPPKSSTPNSAGERKDNSSGSGSGTPSSKRGDKKRFIIF